MITENHVLEKQSLVCELCFLQEVTYLRSRLWYVSYAFYKKSRT